VTTAKYEETTRFGEAGAIVIRIFVLCMLAMLGVMSGIVDGVIVYSLIMNSPDRGWVLPASIYLLAVIVGPNFSWYMVEEGSSPRTLDISPDNDSYVVCW
jgi:hypothetical protein